MISYCNIPKMYQPGKPVQKELRIILEDLFLLTPRMVHDDPIF